MTSSEWRAQIEARGTLPGPPCAPIALQRAVEKLGIPLPAALERLYLTANGFFDVAGQWWVVWPLERLVEDNISARKRGLNADLLAFGDDGTGNPFCLRLTSDDGKVLRWNWIDLEIESSSGSLGDFLSMWARVSTWPPPIE